MDHLPIFMSLKGRRALVVGGGEPAARKVRHLRAASAETTVVAPEAVAELEELAARGDITLWRRSFAPRDLDGAVIAFAATGIAEVDARVAELARAAGIPVNAVDRPAHSTFIMPAIVDRDPITIGISSGGTAPLLVRRLRAELESRLPAALGRLARFAGSFRTAVKANVRDPAARARFWERFFDGPVASAVLDGDERRALVRMLALVNRPQSEGAAGEVAIVGAGPGDPDLLTLGALQALQAADVVVHDRLIGPKILDYARRDAERIFVGKSRDGHAMDQDAINDLLVRLAGAGKRVVRLKGGDPFIFGRGGEEQEALRRRGVAVRVVPGVTAATGCAASAGFPLTHRDHASSVTFLTGQLQDGAPEPDWASLARGSDTLVVYMGVATAGTLAARLIAHGLDPATPAAVVENGTLPDERVVAGTVGSLAAMVRAHGIAPPALIVIGEVARLAEATPAHAVAV
ncbi:MAG: siroheme synthase CysG [Alphaproteobacteria bacterium]